jgi:hypothetical protein
MTISDLIAMHNLGFTCVRMSPELHRCRITCEDQGMGFVHKNSTTPTLVEALTRVAKAAQQHTKTKLHTGFSANRDEESFEHWCLLYGYDPESEEDHARYLTIRRKAEQLKYVIGIPAYKRLLQITEGNTETN